MESSRALGQSKSRRRRQRVPAVHVDRPRTSLTSHSTHSMGLRPVISSDVTSSLNCLSVVEDALLFFPLTRRMSASLRLPALLVMRKLMTASIEFPSSQGPVHGSCMTRLKQLLKSITFSCHA